MRIVLVIVSLLAVGCAGRSLPYEGQGTGGGLGAGEGDLGSPSGRSFDLASTNSSDMSSLRNADLATTTDGGTESEPLFLPYVTVALPGNQDDFEAAAVAIGDVTGDGRNDVVVLAQNLNGANQRNLIVVYPQMTTGQLGPPSSFPLLDGYIGGAAIALGDLNGDGRLDVAATGRSDVELLYQNAAGSLEPAQSLTPSRLGAQEATVAIADLDGDGRVDVAAAGYQTGLDVWYQSGGTLGSPVNFDCTADALAVTAIGDLDGDGRLDVALSGEQVPSGCVLLQRPGGFGASIPVDYGRSAESISVGDLNGDGRADLIAVGGGNRPMSYVGVATLAKDGTAVGSFQWMTSYDIPGAVVVADVDGDQRADAVVVHDGWDAVGLYLQQSDGTLAAERLVDFAYINWGVNHLAVGDINGDGQPDIVAVDFGVYILLHR